MKYTSSPISLLFLLLWVGCLPLAGQEGIINGKDDIAFARQLAQWGYYDLAKSMADKIAAADNLSSAQRQAGEILRCSFLQIRGDREDNLQKKSQLYQQAIDCHKRLIAAAYGKGKYRRQLDLGDVLIDQARGMILQAEEAPEEEAQQLYRQARPLLNEGQALFLEIKSASDNAGSDLDPRNQTNEEKERLQLANIRYHAWYGYCRCLYFLAVCGKRSLFDRCLNELEAYIWDYEGRVGAYYAILLRGMVFDKLKKYKDAVTCYDGVLLALKDTYLFRTDAAETAKSLRSGKLASSWHRLFQEKKLQLAESAAVKIIKPENRWLIIDRAKSRKYLVEKDGALLNVYQIVTSDAAQTLRLQACYYKAKTLVNWPRFSKAIETVSEFQRYLKEIHDSELVKDPLGQGAILEMGKAFVGEGEYHKAIEIAQKIAQAENYWGILAKRYLQRWGKLDPGALANAKNAYLVASGLWDKDQYQEAILSFLKVVQYAKSRGDIENYALDAWEKLGQCFWFLSLYKESALCYRRLATEFSDYRKVTLIGDKEQKIEVGSKAAYWAYRAYLQSYRISGESEDQRLASQMRSYLTNKWPDSTYALNRTYDEAREIENQANEANSSQQAVEKYRQAALAYQKVKSGADQYEPALVSVGKCYFKAGEQLLKSANSKNSSAAARSDLEKAAQQLLAYHSYAEGNAPLAIDPRGKARRQESMAQSTFYLARVYLYLEKYEEASAQLRKLILNYPEQSEMVAGAFFFLVRLALKAGKLNQAEQLLQEMQKQQGRITTGAAASYQSFCYYLLGKQFRDRAKKLEEKRESSKDPDQRQQIHKEFRRYYRQASDCFNEWLLRKDNASPRHYDIVATRMVVLGQMLEDAGDDKQALSYYRQALPLLNTALKGYRQEEQREEIEIKRTRCLIMMEDWQQALTIFYPIFHRDKDKRQRQRQEEMRRTRQKPTTQRVNPEYLGYIAKILTGLAAKNTFSMPAELYAFLLAHIHRDLQDDFYDFKLESNDPKNLWEKYLRLKEVTAWINGQDLADTERRKLEDEFQKLSKDSKREQLLPIYQQRYQELLATAYPAKPQLQTIKKEPEAALMQKIKRLCLYLAYEFNAILVESLPRYKNPQVPFGFYDNPEWWAAKYRQIYVVYLRGERKTARALIEALSIQQENLGGGKYKQMFNELLNKTK